MARMRLTKRSIDAVKRPAARQADYHDTEVKGLTLRVFASGRKVFLLKYRFDGQRKAIKLGDYGALTPTTAARKARALLAKIDGGIDPQAEAEAKRNMPTFRQWAERYLDEVRQRKKRPDSDERFLGMAAARYGGKKLDKVTRADVENHMQELRKVGKTAVTANRYHASVRACLNEACRAGFLQYNPAANIRHYPEPTPRDRTLSDDEMERVLAAIDKIGDVFVETAIHMLIETGARKTEVLSARWDDIKFEDGLWRLPVTKSGRPQVIPLSTNILARLRLLPRTGEWLFPGTGDGHREDVKKAWAQIRKDADIPDVRLHDVRRTFGLHIARTAGLHVASRLLRHSSIKVTEAHYAPLGVDELRAALEKRSAAIVPLRGKVKR